MGLIRMSDTPFVPSELSEVAKQAKGTARSLLPWLPDPFECPDCGVFCEATRVYDPQQAAFHPMGMCPAWECPECEMYYRRDEPWF